RGSLQKLKLTYGGVENDSLALRRCAEGTLQRRSSGRTQSRPPGRGAERSGGGTSLLRLRPRRRAGRLRREDHLAAEPGGDSRRAADGLEPLHPESEP